MKRYPYSGPRTTSAHVATYHFCTRLMISVPRLRFEAFRLSLTPGLTSTSVRPSSRRGLSRVELGSKASVKSRCASSPSFKTRLVVQVSGRFKRSETVIESVVLGNWWPQTPNPLRDGNPYLSNALKWQKWSILVHELVNRTAA